MRSFAWMLVGGLVAYACGRASASVEVIPNGAGGATIVSYSVTTGSLGSIVIVNAYGNPGGGLIVQVTGVNEGIQSITIVPQTNPPYAASALSVGLTVRGKPGTSGSVGYLGSISRSGTNGDLLIGPVTVVGNIGDPASPNSTSIVGQAINSIIAVGDIAASIQATGSSQFNGNITTVQSTGGRILGDIKAAAVIATQIKASSTIGTASHTVNIGGGTYCALIQGSAIYANINDGSGGPMGQLAQLVTTSDGFHGTINAASIRGAPTGTNSLDVASDLDANVTLTGDVGGPVAVAGNFTSGKTFKINGGVVNSGSDNGSLHFGSGGLKGQVIVNASAGSATWGGTAQIDGTTLSTLPYYSQASDSLGGGAVGLVPFRLYGNDCTPVNNNLIPAAHGDPKTTIVTTDFNAGGSNSAVPVKIRFYGPISYADVSSWTGAVVIECASLFYDSSPCSATQWMDVTQGFLVRGPGDSGWADARGIGLSRYDSSTFIGPGIYRVRFPHVYCAGLGLDEPPLVKAAVLCSGDSNSAAYYFRVGADCNENNEDDAVDPSPGVCNGGCGDFNQDGNIDVTDIFNFLTAWFNNCTAVSSPNCLYGSADFNHSGTINVTDIFNFLTAWFAGPTSCH